ncbi:hypothetical protein J0X19_22110 [Hymenobacter sp. BT186]|uniref:Uncharacterized protein n=1 Tax=Hymenobacter telluris TaxID=2816474 RepID=A0A939JCY1_9BACT|nr:hypothetical protein [Hymenobacter telluris]MBO0360671.1 hypothetical protein [Hymenobacter telluris]MBW3376698.1 hypothetical protein [Hymenobacter norwichensis]
MAKQNAATTPATTPTPAATAAPANETPEQKIARLEAEIAAKDTIIVGQAEQLQAAEAGAAEGRPVVTHDSKHYRVLAKQFDYKGVTIKGTELKEQADVIKYLVESESGVLQLITKEEASAEAQA